MKPYPLLAFLALLAAALVAAYPASSATSATSPVEALAILNAERQANGIPPLTLNAQWSEGCAEYVHYLSINPGAFATDAHHEQPGNPGYSADGALAAEYSELVGGDDWLGQDAFDSAPLHLSSLLDPLIGQIGAAFGNGYSCVTAEALDDSLQTGPNVFYTYPGDGRAGVPVSEDTSSEIPDPTTILSLAEPTGPYLLVYGTGEWTAASHWSFTVSQASLTGPGGAPVAITVIDQNTPGFAIYVPVSAAMIVPDTPLAGHTTYTASITATSDRVTLSHSWTFTTRAAPKPPVLPAEPPPVSGNAKVASLRLSNGTPRTRQVAAVSFSYRLSDDSGLLQFTLARKLVLHGSHGRCYLPGNPTLVRCVSWMPLKNLAFRDGSAVHEGSHTLPLTRLAPRGLAPGLYQISAVADSGFATVSFRVRP